MTVPPCSDPRWRPLVSGAKDPPLASFPTKLILQRLRRTVQKDPDQMDAAIQELHAFFVSNLFAQKDLEVI
jgi:hypothetical protein